MDPFTQGVLGAAGGQLVSNRQDKLKAAIAGGLSGMAADLDVLIRSNSDPLLALEYHRQFTHALIFIPFGALICSLVFFFLYFRSRLSFKQTYLFCVAGYATHALLDACTTYGTQLLWPFSNARIAWNNVSVVDPLFTLPLLVLLVLSITKKSKTMAIVSMAYALSYLGLGWVQQQRAESYSQRLAQSRGHTPVNLGLKPSYANLIAWKSIYEHQGRYYVDAIRVALDGKVIEGTSTEKLDLERHFPWLPADSQQARDVERFRWFSNQYLGVDPNNASRIIDVRYSLIPNRLDGMWGIVLDRRADSTKHISWSTSRPSGVALQRDLDTFWSMLVE